MSQILSSRVDKVNDFITLAAPMASGSNPDFAPINSGSLYFNYKKYFSIVLLAACDAKYRFTWVDIGQYGSVSDGGVWNNTDFAEALEKGLVDIPPPKNLPNTNIITHYAFVGDEAFPLKLYMLRPYSKDNLTISLYFCAKFFVHKIRKAT
ncbi:PREDICTED: uncharacterized protein LOC105556438 [Vollenhovia emeryi]|uniref:uncharacterized protein LOC105556438 n=1 Tax=Vollenhovia emeryi TaxID=411798 RepID=UPI0005F473CE|nr:PREDICTED: uncharacterized protein LOC105556438 [Vollenhovia emeryi]